MFVNTLDVAIGTQLKQLCLWICNMCFWPHDQQNHNSEYPILNDNIIRLSLDIISVVR